MVKDAAGNDVTSEFKVNTVNGKLTVDKRKVTLTSATDSKVYDGTELTSKDVAVSGDGFADGEGASYDVTGTRTAPGSSDNTFDYALNAGTKAGKADITKTLGTLTVTSRGATQGVDRGVRRLRAGHLRPEADHLPGGRPHLHRNGPPASASGTDAGEYAANVTGTPVVKDAAGNDVTSEFKVNTVNGKLTVDKRGYSVVTKSATCQGL